jgi:hypothetical protein
MNAFGQVVTVDTLRPEWPEEVVRDDGEDGASGGGVAHERLLAAAEATGGAIGNVVGWTLGAVVNAVVGRKRGASVLRSMMRTVGRWQRDLERRDPPEGGPRPLGHYFGVVEIEGDYAEYLERRLPPFVRSRPHWAAKGLMEIELKELADGMGVAWNSETPLYCPPPEASFLTELPSSVVSGLNAAGEQDLQGVAERWAATMSSPSHTHSVTGQKISNGWSVSHAARILQNMVAVARQAGIAERMYLLTEV